MLNVILGCALFISTFICADSSATIRVVVASGSESHARYVKQAMENIIPTERIEMQTRIIAFPSVSSVPNPRKVPSDLSKNILSFLRSNPNVGNVEIHFWIVTEIHLEESGERWMSIDFEDKNHARLSVFTRPFNDEESLKFEII